MSLCMSSRVSVFMWFARSFFRTLVSSVVMCVVRSLFMYVCRSFAGVGRAFFSLFNRYACMYVLRYLWMVRFYACVMSVCI